MELSEYHPDDLISELEAAGNIVISDDQLGKIIEYYKDAYALGHASFQEKPEAPFAIGIAKGIRNIMVGYLGFTPEKLAEFEAEALEEINNKKEDE